jgi:hypothetical protein
LRFVFELQAGTFLFKRFDAEPVAFDAPITTFVILYFRKLSALIPRPHLRAA